MNKSMLNEQFAKYSQWIINRAREGHMIDFGADERKRIYGQWIGYELFCALLDVMIERGLTIEDVQ
jgi:hypothetical protein